jgi:thiamine pyrophosphokinase
VPNFFESNLIILTFLFPCFGHLPKVWLGDFDSLSIFGIENFEELTFEDLTFGIEI